MKRFLILFLILLSISNASQANSIISDDGNSIQITEDLKLYDNPSIYSNVLTIIKTGSIITIVSTEGEFSKIKYLNLTGYIITSNLKTYKVTNSTFSSNNYSAKSTTRTSKTKTTKSKSKSTNYNRSTNYSSTCGASTKKGGSCQRRVSGGGYCWQHR